MSERDLELMERIDTAVQRLADVAYRRGQRDEAKGLLSGLAPLVEELSVASDVDDLRQALVGYLHLEGRSREAEAIHRLIGAEDRERLMGNEAWIAACRGDRQGCFEIMERSLQGGPVQSRLAFCGMDVEFDRFRDDPRFPAPVN